jgi:uncharacterized protein (DUF4415 family)
MKNKSFSAEEQAELEALAALADGDIDTADIPEAPSENWLHARRGEFYRPLKQPVTIRLDADVLAWFKENVTSGGYQTEINRVLRQHVLEIEKKRA